MRNGHTSIIRMLGAAVSIAGLVISGLAICVGSVQADTFRKALAPAAYGAAVPVAPMSDGSIIYAYMSANYATNIYVSKLDSKGTATAIATIASSNSMYVGSLGVTDDGYVYLTGQTTGALVGLTNPTGKRQSFLVKISLTGQISWKVQGIFSEDVSPTLAVLTDGSVSVGASGWNDIQIKHFQSGGSNDWNSSISIAQPTNVPLQAQGDSTYVTYLAGASPKRHLAMTKLDFQGQTVWTVDSSETMMEIAGVVYNSNLSVLQVLSDHSYGASDDSAYIWSVSLDGQETTMLPLPISDLGTDFVRAASIYSKSDGSYYVGLLGGRSASEVILRKYVGVTKIWELHRSDGDSFLQGLVISDSNEISYSAGTMRKNIGEAAIPALSDVHPQVLGRQTSITSWLKAGASPASVEMVVSTSPDLTNAVTQSVTTTPQYGLQKIEYLPTGLMAGTRYYFRLHAVNSLGHGYSDTSSFTTPDAPDEPRISALRSGLVVNLSWAPPESYGYDVSNYQVQKKNSPTSEWVTLNNFSPTPGSTQTYSDTNALALAASKPSYRVRATTYFDSSDWSNVVDVQLPESPQVPHHVSARLAGKDVEISWLPPSNYVNADVLEYKVEATSDGLTWSPVEVSLSKDCTVIFRAGFVGATYRFRVKAMNVVGESALSEPTSALKIVVAPKQIQAKAVVKPTVSGVPIATASGKYKYLATKGTWSGSPTPVVTYRWYACSVPIAFPRLTVPATCQPIKGATKSSLVVRLAYKNKYVAVAVTGKSMSTSSTTWLSKSSAKIR